MKKVVAVNLHQTVQVGGLKYGKFHAENSVRS